MPLWDAARAQVDMLKSASDVDPDADFIFYHDISTNIMFRELAREARGLQSFSIQTSPSTAVAPLSLTNPYKLLVFPCRFRLVKIGMSVEWASSTGAARVTTDVLNSTASVVGGGAGAAAGRIVCENNVYFGQASIFASMSLINQYDVIKIFITSNAGGARAPIVHLIGYRE